jgi:hypothetical protein
MVCVNERLVYQIGATQLDDATHIYCHLPSPFQCASYRLWFKLGGKAGSDKRHKWKKNEVPVLTFLFAVSRNIPMLASKPSHTSMSHFHAAAQC